MVGGAMFSAPMVEEASESLDISRERRTFLNYWFRHTMEPVFPLYPSLVLAAGLMGVPVQTLTVTQVPIFLAAVAGGLLFGLVGIRGVDGSSDHPPGRKDTLILLLRSIWPILLVLALSVVLKVDLILSLLLTLAALIVVQRLGPRRILAAAKGTPLGTVPIIFGTMVFRRILETSGALETMSQALTASGIPLPVIVFAVPLMAGVLTGLAVGAFAIAFPIVLPLCGPDLVSSGYGLLAYTGGFVGLMVSPLHLCLALTRVYYKAEWGGVYQRILPAAILLTLTAAIVAVVK
jgi:integral membrane protein (TIGR00529 family)